MPKSLWAQKGSDELHGLVHDIRRSLFNPFGLASTPVEASELIRQDNALHGSLIRQSHFERVTLRFAGNWADQSEACLALA